MFFFILKTFVNYFFGTLLPVKESVGCCTDGIGLMLPVVLCIDKKTMQSNVIESPVPPY